MRPIFNLEQFRKERAENYKKKQETIKELIKDDLQRKIDFYGFKEEDFNWNSSTGNNFPYETK